MNQSELEELKQMRVRLTSLYARLPNDGIHEKLKSDFTLAKDIEELELYLSTKELDKSNRRQ